MNLKHKLDYHYKAFDKSQISPDPLQFLHQFSSEKDIEVIGFIASIFAYGNVTQIINTLNKIVTFTEDNPYKFVVNFKSKNYHKKLTGLKHRFYTENDIKTFFYVLNDVYKNYDSLKNLFLKNYDGSEGNIKNALGKYSQHLIEKSEQYNDGKITRGVRFMFPLPEVGSACKRMNLFLRWMVRHDELDFGLWKEVETSKLIIPVDTHIARICKLLKLTDLKNVNWKMAEQITANLKKFDPNDPVKYDFAICHIGMRKLDF